MATLKKTPQINAASMADISFILFIFFLMVTTMGTDWGLIRMLPPWQEDVKNNTDKINERNIMVVNVNQSNYIMVNKAVTDISEVRAKTKEFYSLSSVGERFPEKEEKQLPLLGTVNVNKTAIVALQNDRSTSYKTYIQVQNELAGAVHELRDEFCLQRFGSKFDDCSKEQQDVVSKDIYPMSISESEPRDLAKNKK
jgi:biopolymer transport protein ExbD